MHCSYWSWLLGGLVAASATACASTQVVRVFDGQATAGPYVSDETYAAYVRGALLEASGEYQSAAAAYERALVDSPESAAIWVRLAAVRCRLGATAQAELSQAYQLDPEYAPLWREWAQCSLGRGQAARARTLAERGLALDPDDDQTTLLMARIEEQLGHTERSGELLVAQGMRSSGSGAVWRAALKLAQRGKDATLARIARAGLRHAGLPDPTRATQGARRLALLAVIDRALLADDLDLARQLAPRARLSAGALAVRAAVVGAARAAHNQAGFVLDADPINADAWIAGLVAADLLDDEARFESSLARWSPAMGTPSPEAARLYHDLLGRRVGSAAAHAWSAALPSHATPAPE
ncbi:MAG: tetratricopeptide repeat protein [Polyangiaceae bacterium]|nr:tetratricopeptide repeat protein [Polyangiaceae bacterium]